MLALSQISVYSLSSHRYDNPVRWQPVFYWLIKTIDYVVWQRAQRTEPGHRRY